MSKKGPFELVKNTPDPVIALQSEAYVCLAQIASSQRRLNAIETQLQKMAEKKD